MPPRPSIGPLVSETAEVDAPPSAVFAVLADPRRHAEIDGSGNVVGAVRSRDVPLRLGSTFSTRMRMGVPYAMRNRVVEHEPDRLIAWTHVSRVRWRYELEPLDGGTRTRVTESWDARPSVLWPLYRRLSMDRYARRAIHRTLPLLAAAATGTAARPSGT